MSPREQVVVVGAGMVGHRFVEELVAHDRDHRFDVHLVGAEEYEPYNRILLTEVLAKRSDVAALTLPRPHERVSVQRGVAATSIDRAEHLVELDDGTALQYDHLVLATGARAFVPPIEGLRGTGDDEPPRHVHVLRTIDDCRDVVARTVNARHAVVLGGGVLGLEAACGLARRGLAVTVVHLDGHLMADQLDPAVASVLARALDDLGVRVHTSTSVAEVIGAYGELVAVRLTDGSVVSTDLMLVSCGIRPETGLAAAAGLPTGRGVTVGADLASPEDSSIRAIGDCAETPDGITGLVAPGWEQAARLARLMTGAPQPSGSGRCPSRGGSRQGRRGRPGHPRGAGRCRCSRRPGGRPLGPAGPPTRRGRRTTRPAGRVHRARCTPGLGVALGRLRASYAAAAGSGHPAGPADRRPRPAVHPRGLADADPGRRHHLPVQRRHQERPDGRLGRRLPHRGGDGGSHPRHDRLRRLPGDGVRSRRLAHERRRW